MVKSIREKSKASPPLHTHEILPHTRLNHVFAIIYIFALVALFYHHLQTLLYSTTTLSFFLHLTFLLSDVAFAFMWASTQGFRIRPIKRKTYPENLSNVIKPSEYPAMDVFICTADPFKEPPLGVVNTALSAMAYDYPTDKLSVYISDDGGSKLTLFAFMEAAKFATHWLPFCKEKHILERSPEAYFASNEFDTSSSETNDIKMMYDTMKMRVESVVERGDIGEEYITGEKESQAFAKWTPGCNHQDHPTIIQVLLENGKDKDICGHGLPNLVYVSREKKKNVPHLFKAGALNVLLRVSATMTNAPLLLTLDCDMRSNDPTTPMRALCFLMDPGENPPTLAFIQFPQRFHGINKNDTYGSEHRRCLRICKPAMDGNRGSHYCGTGCFFRRRAFFGGPSTREKVEAPKLDPYHVVDKPISSEETVTIAHKVASSTYEKGTHWGYKVGVRYGSLVEDLYTSYRLLCEGWKSAFCDPDGRAPFLGDIPITLDDNLGQERRWALGLLEMGFSEYGPIIFGTKHLGVPMGLCFTYWSFWGIWSFPISVYAASSSWVYLYMFLVIGAYGQDFFDFWYYGGTLHQWYNDQRMWMTKGISSYLFASVDYILKVIGMPAFGFNVTSKVVDDEQNNRYEQGLFEFGDASPMFMPITTAAILNLIGFTMGVLGVFRYGNLDEMFVQLCLTGFVMVNSWPVYEAIALRADRGKMPAITTLTSIFLAWIMFLVSLFIFKR
ncbi:hypothetical protein ACHQM5_028643 [Ranunculus cassubicifolius]